MSNILIHNSLNEPIETRFNFRIKGRKDFFKLTGESTQIFFHANELNSPDKTGLSHLQQRVNNGQT